MSSIFFTADTHFGHENIVGYCGRPFSSAEEMDEIMVQRWNEVVKPQDVVYHLGDLALVNRKKLGQYLSRLNGNIHLVKGNHDIKVLRGWVSDAFCSVQDYLEVRFGGRKLILCHYPFESWRGSAHGKNWHLHGHCHGTLKPRANRMDVGVDTHEFAPYHMDEIADIMEDTDG